MKKLILTIFLLLLLFNYDLFSQRRNSGFKSNFKSSNSKGYNIPQEKTSSSYKLPKPNYNYKSHTYKIGGTQYSYGETYKSTGLPKVKRNSTAKKEFLRSKGYSKTPKGYEVDHIIPLSKGGQDVPSNMQLLPKEVHKQKTARERKER